MPPAERRPDLHPHRCSLCNVKRKQALARPRERFRIRSVAGLNVIARHRIGFAMVNGRFEIDQLVHPNFLAPGAGRFLNGVARDM